MNVSPTTADKQKIRLKSVAGVRFRVVNDRVDIPKIVDLAREAHAEMLAEKDGAPVGFAYCSVGEYHIGTDVLLTTIHNINVSRRIRQTLSGGRVALGLFRGIETWSKARGVQEILFHVTSDINLARAHKLAKRMGFKFIGGSYAKSV